MSNHSSHACCAAVTALFLLCTVAVAQDDASSTGSEKRNFSFLHLSDIHVETFTSVPQDLTSERSFRAVRTVPEVAEIQLPNGKTAPEPSFLIVTGDITEFGFAGATGEVVDKYFEPINYPKYFATGNHDNTFAPPTNWFREKYGSQNYSFDHGGCRFVALNSASLQDPNPSFGHETIRFLKETLRTLDNNTPVFCFFHHPLYGGEFCSSYDSDRVVDALRAHNAVLFLVGHGHNARKMEFAGIPATMGGSTFSKGPANNDGYAVVYVDGNELSVAYKRAYETTASKQLLQRRIPRKARYPSILTSVGKGEKNGSGTLQLSATISGTSAPLAEAVYEIDDATSGPLRITGATGSAELASNSLLPGAHFVRYKFRDQSGEWYQRSMAFYNDPPDGQTTASAVWRFEMGGGTRSTPLVKDGRVYIGANDGILYALDASNGRKAWTFDAGAEIGTSPASYGELLLFGAANGKFHALNSEGKSQWVYDAGVPIFGSPVVDESGTVYFGSQDGIMTALDARTGKEKWRNREAFYSIESKPLLHDGKLYVGAWDGLVYCYDVNDGEVLWKKPSTYNQKRVIRYYAAADATPVTAGGNLYVSDRGYYGGRYTLAGTFEELVADDVTAFAPSQDGQALYLRQTKSGLRKTGLDGRTIWESGVVAGRIPAAPVEQDGRVYVVTNAGTLQVLDANTGSVQYTYQVTPRLFVMAAPAVHDDVVYTAGMDGVLTAIRIPAARGR